MKGLAILLLLPTSLLLAQSSDPGTPQVSKTSPVTALGATNVTVDTTGNNLSVPGTVTARSANFSVGTPSAPITNLSYSNPIDGAIVHDGSAGDTTPGCGGNTGHGMGYPLAVRQTCLFEHNTTGTPAVVPDYTYLEGQPGFRGYLSGTSANVAADQGSSPRQLFHNTTVADNVGWTIESCSRSEGEITATLKTTGAYPVSSAPLTLKTGHGVYINGNSACNTGGNGIAIVTRVSGSSFSARQGGPNTPKASGGIAAPNHMVWTMEHNLFNNSFDPGPIDSYLGQNVYPIWGVTATEQSQYGFLGTSAFFADGGWYEGYFTPDNRDAGFVAGNPTSTTTGLKMKTAFRVAPRQLASAAGNYCSLPIQFQDSVYNGSSFTKPSYQLQLCPEAGPNAGSHLDFVDVSGKLSIQFAGNQVRGLDGSARSPNFSDEGNPATGWYVNSNGSANTTVEGVDRFAVSSSAITATVPVVAPSVQLGSKGVQWTTGNKDPAGSCATGSLFSNSSGEAGHVFWVCVGGTWIDIK